MWSSSHPVNNTMNWDKIWETKTPEKIKFFLWLIGWDRLPTRALLKQRNISEQDHCPFCPDKLEDTLHILCQCPRALELWQNTEQYLLQHNPSENMVVWMERNLKKDTPLKDIPWNIWFPFCIWRIWLRRNRWIFDKKSLPIDKFWKDTMALVQAFYYLSCLPNAKTTLVKGDYVTKENSILFYVDASFSLDNLTAGLAGIFSNNQGVYLGGFTKQIKCHNANAAELQAIMEAIKWSNLYAWTNVVIYSDAQTAVTGITTTTSRRDMHTNLYMECRELQGNNTVLEWRSREGMMDVDVIARAARKAKISHNYLLSLDSEIICNISKLSKPVTNWITFLEGAVPSNLTSTNSETI